MAVSYRAQVATAFEVLADGLAPFVDDRMSAAYPDEDWVLMAATKLGKRRDVLVSLSDPHFQLEVINRWWGPAFAAVLGENMRQTITDLRTARNHWAHPDEDHPFDLDYALRVHQWVEDVLRACDAPEADHVVALADQLRWDGVRDQAREKGMSEADALMEQLTELQKAYDELNAHLAEARAAARSATGRQRAVARQLAELQSQYAAVSGLRDEYLVLRRQLDEERTKREALLQDTTAVREQLARAEAVLDGLQEESTSLRQQLATTRASLSDVDPVETEAGRRWIWLITALVVVMGVVIVLASELPR
ncbi:Swt1 family HEPN domain-containing protein [Rhabdothermincola sediminis]|uniref:Swt1 family HEPN domain-containing protein n=1 Tax=Rhabdothermincola sediminis TaxID=2751370 RepID=UPI001AA04624|nr:Swt1 family HEPN domain-containing protein [Rhabdothermincola sediminis]